MTFIAHELTPAPPKRRAMLKEFSRPVQTFSIPYAPSRQCDNAQTPRRLDSIFETDYFPFNIGIEGDALSLSQTSNAWPIILTVKARPASYKSFTGIRVRKRLPLRIRVSTFTKTISLPTRRPKWRLD